MKILSVLFLICYVKINFGRSVTDGRYENLLGLLSDLGRSKSNGTKDLSSVLRSYHEVLNPSTERIWEFEDLDYMQVIGDQQKEYEDCIGINIKCVVDRIHIHPTCGQKNVNYERWDRYMSSCEMDYWNCLRRVKNGLGVYGTSHGEDYLEMTDEGYKCTNMVPPGVGG